jgi:hypothetical protein
MIHRSLSPHLTSVPMDNALNGRQSYTGPFKFFGQVQPLKNAEEFIDISHVKPSAVIPHEHLHVAWSICATDLDLGWRSRPGEFNCIRN